MKILWFDQMNWRIVCDPCFSKFQDKAWSGQNKFADYEEWFNYKLQVQQLAEFAEFCTECKSRV